MSRATYHSRFHHGGNGTEMFNRATTKKLNAVNRWAALRPSKRVSRKNAGKIEGEAVFMKLSQRRRSQ